MALEAIVVREVRWAGDDENNEDDEPPVFSKIISTDEPSDVTLWPEPITTIDDGDESEPPRFSKIQSTTDDVAEDTERWPFPTETLPIVSSDPSTMVTQTIITEESTITGGLITKTDSGRTVTVPNNEVVTVTRHTVIITDKPPPLPTETTFQTSGVLTSSLPGGETTQVPEQEGREDVDGESHGPSLTTGALVGVSVGGAIVIALFILVVFGLRKRRQKSRDDGDAARPIEYGRDQDLEEKHFPEQMTPHTTGTQPDDPFAPFGGTISRKVLSSANFGLADNSTNRSRRSIGRGC